MTKAENNRKLRASILKAARIIERQPEKYDFYEGDIPKENTCGTQTCALGWVHFYYQPPKKAGIFINPQRIGMGVSEEEFYDRMDAIQMVLRPGGYFLTGWRSDHRLCARVLRRYADEYHPLPKKPKAVPVEQKVEVREEVCV